MLVLSLDLMDMTGEQQVDISHDIFKTRLDEFGNALDVKKKMAQMPKKNVTVAANETSSCGDCYGAQETVGDCCHSCKDVEDRYHKKGWAMPDYQEIKQVMTR
jgi:hypothetical protein